MLLILLCVCALQFLSNFVHGQKNKNSVHVLHLIYFRLKKSISFLLEISNSLSRAHNGPVMLPEKNGILFFIFVEVIVCPHSQAHRYF